MYDGYIFVCFVGVDEVFGDSLSAHIGIRSKTAACNISGVCSMELTTYARVRFGHLGG